MPSQRKAQERICTKVLADEIEKDVPLANEKEWNINGENITIGVEKKH
jgi:isoleucyl-tRNA synthetase